MKFTHEPESHGQIPFLDIMITKHDDESVKLNVLNSHHPLHHKLNVVRTMFDRCNNLVTDPKDRGAEEAHINNVLKKCVYPEWTVGKVKKRHGKETRTDNHT